MHKDGFTLIELMIALAVAAVLAVIAYPSYSNAMLKARRTEGRAALMKLMQQQERYYSQHASYIAFAAGASDPDAARFRWYSGDSPATSTYEISAVACANESLRDCVMLVAKPGTAKVNGSFKDEACGELSLTSMGVKSSSGKAAGCWK